jgi:hypothetical protein
VGYGIVLKGCSAEQQAFLSLYQLEYCPAKPHKISSHRPLTITRTATAGPITGQPCPSAGGIYRLNDLVGAFFYAPIVLYSVVRSGAQTKGTELCMAFDAKVIIKYLRFPLLE